MSRDDAYAILFMVGVLAVLLTIPAFVVLWWLHLRQSRRHPERIGAYGWILMLGPPALMAGIYFGSQAYASRLNEPGRQGGQWDGLGEALIASMWMSQLLVGWVVSLAAEIPTYLMRARLVSGGSAPASPGGHDAESSHPDIASDGAASTTVEQPTTHESLDTPPGPAAGRVGAGALPPLVVFVVGALSAVIGIWPYVSRLQSPSDEEYGTRTGPQILLPFAYDLGTTVTISYGVILTGAGLAAMALRYARSRYPGTEARVALWGVLAVQGLALLQSAAVLVGEGRADGSMAAKAVGVLAWMALGALVFRLVALGSRASALIGLTFVSAAASWSILAGPLSMATGFWLLDSVQEQLVASGPLLGLAIVWSGLNTVRKVLASAVAIGINWVLCTALGTLWALTPQTETDIEILGRRTWGGEFVANLLTPTTLFFTIAVPIAVAALGEAFRRTAVEAPRSRESVAASTADAKGVRKPYSPGPLAVFVVGAVSALIGLSPYVSRVPQPGGSDDAAGPLLLLPFAPVIGISLQISYGVILTGAGLAAIALRSARARFPAISVRVALWGVIAIQGAAVLQAMIVPASGYFTTGAKAMGALVWMALGAWVFHLVALGSRATALIGLAFVAVAAAWPIVAWPLSWVFPYGLLDTAPDQLLVPGPLIGVAIAWAGFDTVRKVRASAAAIGITWVLYTALRALWVLNPQTESGAAFDGVRRWVGEFVANLLTPTTLFFTIAVPMAVAALGIALRQSSGVAAPARPEPAEPPTIRAR